MVVVEVITASGILALIALILKQMWKRMDSVESKHLKALYKGNGQLVYMTENRCIASQQDILDKINEIKALIIEMDNKRESTRDQSALNQLKIESRLTKIETKIDENGRGGYD